MTTSDLTGDRGSQSEEEDKPEDDDYEDTEAGHQN
jgi:hypothetical protein